jgi:hypothetical protein
MMRDTEMDETLWKFRFGVEVSTLYHDWRRAHLVALVRVARAATFAGAIITLLTALNPLDWAPHSVALVVGVTAVAIACINLWELVFHLNEIALQHTELYRRFMKLQETIAREQGLWKERLPQWEAEAAAIRSDEPPTMWAVYAEGWNQSIDRYQLDKKGYYRPVRLWQHWLRHVLHFNPQDFPAAV